MSINDVIAEHRRLAQIVKSKRAEPLGALATTYRDAMALAAKMEAEGYSKAEREAFVANAMKAAWPKSREEPWHYGCEQCNDCGWVFKTCVKGSCGRPFKFPGQSGEDHTGQGRCQDGHTYVVPCWCQKGQGIKRQLMKEPRPMEDAIEAAAKTRSKPTRFGR